jgi:thermitase
MRSPLITACLLLLMWLVTPVAAAPPPGSPPPFAEGEVLVAFKPGVRAMMMADIHRSLGGRVIKNIEPLGIQLVAVPAGSVMEKLALYRRSPYTRYAEPNYYRLLGPLQPTLIPDEGDGSLLGEYFDDQWGLHNTGQSFYYFNLMSGTADADIDAAEGWDRANTLGITLGSPEIKVAILDTGVDCAHVDLLTDSGEVKCADITNYTDSPTANDAFGHGTHVAGIVAANTDNTLGVAGVAEQAFLGSFKVCDDNGACPDAAIISGLIEAADAGYQVINMSFGGPDGSQALTDAVEYAWSKGVVLVSSAGNENSTEVGYPARLTRVIAVGATDADDNRASFSNYGDLVSVAAPGDTILSTMPMALCAGDPTGCYEFLSGTSMAGPHVAGIAALVWARDDVSSNEQVRYIIENSADMTGAAGQNLLSWTQYGRANLAQAMSYPTQSGNLPPQPSFYYVCSGLSCDFNGGGSSDPDGDISGYNWSFGDGDSGSGVTANHRYAGSGTYTVTLTVTDDLDASSSTSKTLTVNAASNTPPTAAFSYTCSGRSCTFDGTASSDADNGDTIVQYAWTFGGSGTQNGSGAIVKYDYDSSGTYSVTLTVTDSADATGSATTAVRVKDKGKSTGSTDAGDGGGNDPGSFCERKPDHPKCQ